MSRTRITVEPINSKDFFTELNMLWEKVEEEMESKDTEKRKNALMSFLNKIERVGDHITSSKDYESEALNGLNMFINQFSDPDNEGSGKPFPTDVLTKYLEEEVNQKLNELLRLDPSIESLSEFLKRIDDITLLDSFLNYFLGDNLTIIKDHTKNRIQNEINIREINEGRTLSFQLVNTKEMEKAFPPMDPGVPRSLPDLSLLHSLNEEVKSFSRLTEKAPRKYILHEWKLESDTASLAPNTIKKIRFLLNAETTSSSVLAISRLNGHKEFYRVPEEKTGLLSSYMKKLNGRRYYMPIFQGNEDKSQHKWVDLRKIYGKTGANRNYYLYMHALLCVEVQNIAIEKLRKGPVKINIIDAGCGLAPGLLATAMLQLSELKKGHPDLQLGKAVGFDPIPNHIAICQNAIQNRFRELGSSLKKSIEYREESSENIAKIVDVCHPSSSSSSSSVPVENIVIFSGSLTHGTIGGRVIAAQVIKSCWEKADHLLVTGQTEIYIIERLLGRMGFSIERYIDEVPGTKNAVPFFRLAKMSKATMLATINAKLGKKPVLLDLSFNPSPLQFLQEIAVSSNAAQIETILLRGSSITDWRPISELLERFPKLRKITYDCENASSIPFSLRQNKNILWSIQPMFTEMYGSDTFRKNMGMFSTPTAAIWVKLLSQWIEPQEEVNSEEVKTNILRFISTYTGKVLLPMKFQKSTGEVISILDYAKETAAGEEICKKLERLGQEVKREYRK